MRSVDSRELPGLVGSVFDDGTGILVTAGMVREFATLTGADHWMHVDAERARETPLGRATVQGMLTLSLAARLEKRILAVESADAVFYGFDRVRFPAPLLVDGHVRLEIEIASADDYGDGVQVVLRYRFRSDDGPKPVCVADQIVRHTHRPPATSTSPA